MPLFFLKVSNIPFQGPFLVTVDGKYGAAAAPLVKVFDRFYQAFRILQSFFPVSRIVARNLRINRSLDNSLHWTLFRMIPLRFIFIPRILINWNVQKPQIFRNLHSIHENYQNFVVLFVNDFDIVDRNNLHHWLNIQLECTFSEPGFRSKNQKLDSGAQCSKWVKGGNSHSYWASAVFFRIFSLARSRKTRQRCNTRTEVFSSSKNLQYWGFSAA